MRRPFTVKVILENGDIFYVSAYREELPLFEEVYPGADFIIMEDHVDGGGR